MGYEYSICGYFKNFISDFFNSWGISYQVIIDTRQGGNKMGNLTLGIHQRGKLIDYRMAIEFENRYFGDSVSLYTVSSGFYIYY